MKGITKLKVPSIQKQLKLFVIQVRHPHTFFQFDITRVGYNLQDAIDKYVIIRNGEIYNKNHCVSHTEISVDDINNLFKNYYP